MRIGIDCRLILDPDAKGQAGVAHYIYFLVLALLEIPTEHEFVLFFDERMNGKTQHFQKQHAQHVFIDSKSGRFFHHQKFSRIVRSFRCDVFHGPANIISFGYGGPSVVTIHDLAIYEHPEWFPEGQWFSTKFLVPRSLKKADKVIAVSKHTKKDLEEIFPFTKGKTQVIYEAGASATDEMDERSWNRYAKHLGLSENLIVFLGTLEPRKNIVRLVRAFDQMLDRDEAFRDMQLVLAGAWGWKHDAIREAIMNAEWGGQIKALGQVSAEVKRTLMTRARLFVYPSMYEGFGLPVLEAMEQGTPVITSNTTSLPEVAGNAAELVDPEDTSAIEAAMVRILESSQKQTGMSRKGIKQSDKFSWNSAAVQTIKLYESVGRKYRR